MFPTAIAAAATVVNGEVVAAASAQYVKTVPVVLPAVTEGNVISTVDGVHTAGGFVIVRLMVFTTVIVTVF